MSVETDALVDLGALALRFGRVDRITMHEDGITPESDTDHTVMLALVACAFADAHRELDLDLGLVAQYAIVHDLVEAYVGDTPTLRLPTESSKAEKARREADGFLTMAQQFGTRLPWIARLVASYETRQTPEARYVKAMDKMVPKITHLLNDGVTIRAEGMSREDLVARWDYQLDELREYAADFPAVFELRRELLTMVLNRLDALAPGRPSW